MPFSQGFLATLSGRGYSLSSASSKIADDNPTKVTVLAKNQNGADQMALSNGYVYWYDYGSGSLNSVSESGGKVHNILNVSDASHHAVFGISVENGFVFWGLGNLSTASSYLYKTNALTGATKTLFSTSSTFLGVLGVIAVGKVVFFISDGNIDRISTTGKNLKTLASFPSPLPWMLTYSKGYVYWYDGVYGEVGKVPASGGTATVLSPQIGSSATDYNGVRNIVVKGGVVYWTHNDASDSNSSLYSVTTSGSNFKHLYGIVSMGLLAGVSYYKGNVIFVGPSDIFSIPHGGGTAKVLVSISAFSVSVQSGEVFFTAGTEVAKAPA